MSNIAWSSCDELAVLKVLNRLGVTGIEVAPTKLWPGWSGATTAAAREYRTWAADKGFVVPAMQAVLFDKPDCLLFGTPAQQSNLREHLRRVYALGEALGATVVVLGAPKNRDRGSLTDAEAFDIAATFFRAEGDAAQNCGVSLCMEPNPVAYECNFVTTAAEGLALVREVDSQGFKLHLDAAGLFLAGDDISQSIAQAGANLCHFHVSEPNLGNFSLPQVAHAKALQALQAVGYRGWLSVEMREGPDALAAVETAALYLTNLVAER